MSHLVTSRVDGVELDYTVSSVIKPIAYHLVDRDQWYGTTDKGRKMIQSVVSVDDTGKQIADQNAVNEWTKIARSQVSHVVNRRGVFAFYGLLSGVNERAEKAIYHAHQTAGRIAHAGILPLYTVSIGRALNGAWVEDHAITLFADSKAFFQSASKRRTSVSTASIKGLTFDKDQSGETQRTVWSNRQITVLLDFCGATALIGDCVSLLSSIAANVTDVNGGKMIVPTIAQQIATQQTPIKPNVDAVRDLILKMRDMGIALSPEQAAMIAPPVVIPTVPTWSIGQVIKATDLDSLLDGFTFGRNAARELVITGIPATNTAPTLPAPFVLPVPVATVITNTAPTTFDRKGIPTNAVQADWLNAQRGRKSNDQYRAMSVHCSDDSRRTINAAKVK